MVAIMRALMLVWMVGFVAMSPVLSQGVRPAPRQSPPWVLEGRKVVALDPPTAIRAATAGWAGLGGSFRGAWADLNGDGTDDYILQYRQEECGTGGCPYGVFDGASAKSIGPVFGDPVVVRAESTRGFLNIDAYSHGSATSGSFTSYVFDGRNYVVRSTRQLTGPNVTALFADLNKIPRWQPVK